jgi:PAS domain S-box-containing protein
MKETILIVDDDEGIAVLMERRLANAGFQTAKIPTCREAIEWLKKNEADLVLLDHKLPDMSGRDMAKRLAKRDPRVPFIVVTGHGDERLAAEMMKLGAKDYVVKDASLLELLPTIVPRVLEQVRQEQRLSEAEEQLHRSEEQFRLAFENAQDAILWADPQTGQIINCNRAAEMLLEKNRNEIIGQPQTSLHPSQQSEYYSNLFHEHVEKKHGTTSEAEVMTKSGRTKPVTITASVTEIRGRPIIQGVFRDITETKKAQLALRLSEQCFRAIADYTYSWEVWVSPRGRLLWTNPAVKRVSGYSVEELMSMSDYPGPLIHKDDRPRIDRAFRSAMRGSSGQELEFRLLRKDGSIAWAEMSWQPIYDENGVSQGHRATIRDVTERKESQEKTKESQERFQLLARATNDAIWDWDLVTDKFWHNEAYEMLFGYSADEIGPGAEWWQDHIHPDDAESVTSGIRRAIETSKQTWSDEYRFRRKDGTYAYILDRGFLIRNQQGKPVRMVGSMMDITQRKRSEEELLAYQKQLRSLASELSLAEERLRRRIATNVHDNIGQNLAISKIKLEALSKSAPSAGFADSVDEIRELVAQTIENSRSLTSELSPPVLYELGFEAAVEWLVNQARERHSISASFKTDGRCKALDHNMLVLLFQAVRELLVNVAKHAAAKNVTVSSKRIDHRIEVSVKDDGVGFDVSKVQGGRRQTDGFGLFSIRERLSHVGGTLRIKSKAGSGTEAVLVAPIESSSTKEDPE